MCFGERAVRQRYNFKKERYLIMRRKTACLALSISLLFTRGFSANQNNDERLLSDIERLRAIVWNIEDEWGSNTENLVFSILDCLEQTKHTEDAKVEKAFPALIEDQNNKEETRTRVKAAFIRSLLLEDKKEAYKVFEFLPQRSWARSRLRLLVSEKLLDNKRYKELIDFGWERNLTAKYAGARNMIERTPLPTDKKASSVEQIRGTYVAEYTWLLEALGGVGKVDDAVSLYRQLVPMLHSSGEIERVSLAINRLENNELTKRTLGTVALPSGLPK
jgi:hypothetical protein